jgi:RHS repeat-associated protein
VAQTDSAGALIATAKYAPFGKLVQSTGTSVSGRQFTSQSWDAEAGLTWFGSRYYDPAIGRFTQPDSFTPGANNPMALDSYAYVMNQPTGGVDPSGHWAAIGAFLIDVGAAEIGEFLASNFMVLDAVTVVAGVGLQYTNNPILQSLGMIMAGTAGAEFGGAADIGNGETTAEGMSALGLSNGETVGAAGAVALSTSPISPLDPTVKKAIGWAWTAMGAVQNVATTASSGTKGLMGWVNGHLGLPTGATGGMWSAIVRSGMVELETTAIAVGVAYAVSTTKNTDAMLALGMVAQVITGNYGSLGIGGYSGSLSAVGATYDLAYTLIYPGGRRIDLSDGGSGRTTFEFYYHTGYDGAFALGRQHIRVGDGSGFWEINPGNGPGFFGPGLGWAGWLSTDKITVVMSASQAAAFRSAMINEAKAGSPYIGFAQDSNSFISNALRAATGKAAGDIGINPGLLNF